MKRSGLFFTLGAVAFILLVSWGLKSTSHDFSWEDSYEPASKEPFGTMLFDSLMQESLPGGYENRTFNEDELALLASDSDQVRQLLFLPDKYGFSVLEVRSVLCMVRNGSHIMVVSPYPSEWEDELDYDVNYNRNSIFSYSSFMSQLNEHGHPLLDTLIWQGDVLFPYEPSADASPYPNDTTLIWQAMSSEMDFDSCYYREDVVTHLTNVHDGQVAVTFLYGKGRLTLVATPLIFTNFGVMNPACRKLMLRLMNEFGQAHVVRMVPEKTDYCENMFSVMMQHPPMKLAWRILLCGALLALIVNARRRQRAIQPLRHSRNGTLDFIRQHASLFRSETDHASLVRKKRRALAHELRQKWQVDVDDADPHALREQAARLAACLHRDVHSVMLDLDFINQLSATEGHVSPELFRQAMECMLRLSTPSTSSTRKPTQ